MLQSPRTSFSSTTSADNSSSVHELFETYTVYEVQTIQRRINHDIERKKEDLRILVGERYRDLIDAADTIATMRLSSAKVHADLGILRSKLNGLPSQFTQGLNCRTKKTQSDSLDKRKLTFNEMQVVTELKLLLHVPGEIQSLLEKEEVIPAIHLLLLFGQKLARNELKYEWSFLDGPGQEKASSRLLIMSDSINQYCEARLSSNDSSFQELAECLIVIHIITEKSMKEVLCTWLSQKLKFCTNAVQKENSDFLFIVSSTLQAFYELFFDPDLYSSTTKAIRRYKIDSSIFGLPFTPQVITEYNSRTLVVEEAPRITQLAQIFRDNFIIPLTNLLENEKNYLAHLSTMAQLQDYRQAASKTLRDRSDELIRIVLGPSANIWSHVFQTVFERRAEKIAGAAINEIMTFLNTVGFPKLIKSEATFNLIGFVWKASALTSDGPPLDDTLKLKGFTPSISQLSEDIEFRFAEFLVDVQALGDQPVKEFIATKLEESITAFVEEIVLNCETSMSHPTVGRFIVGLIELCPNLWKLLDKAGNRLKQKIMQDGENCWKQWTNILLETFKSQLRERMESLTPQSIVTYMPVGEVSETENKDTGEKFACAVRIPLQLTHILHSLLFSVCMELSKVGPQCLPKAVMDSLRIEVTKSIIEFYEQLTAVLTDQVLTSQMALQFIFDLKAVQWLHPSLSGLTDGLVQKLRMLIDPFDWDIVSNGVTNNLKRFLFENQLTLGLLFSEESQTFIAQNFKTKQSLSYQNLSKNFQHGCQLPLLPL